MKRICISLTIILLIALCVPGSVRADVAPPGHPPGSNPSPGAESTQVRMMAETVLIEVLPGEADQARVTADFTMRNLGDAVESMGVRFPLSSDNGFGKFPEVRNLKVQLNGKALSTRRVMEMDPVWGSDPVPWAEFDATFPPDQDVDVEVTYMLDGTGEYPFIAYFYILHTGEGWKDSIGSADLIVRLPYEANASNVIFDEETGWSHTIPGGVFNGRDVRWHFDNLEPVRENDFEVSLVMPSAWKKVLNEQANIQKNPDDGEAWGRLGKLYKEMVFFRKGYRHDAGGRELYRLSVEAYGQAVTLKPDDALWHAGFSDLLAVHAYYASQEGENVQDEILRSMQQIDQALDLSPDDPKVNEIADKLYYLFPGSIDRLESGYDLLWLTATPEISTAEATSIESTPTFPAPSPPATQGPSPTLAGNPPSAPTPPSAGNPICGTGMLLPLALILVVRRKRNPLL